MRSTIAILAAAVGGLFAFAASWPSAFTIERSARIDAPPEAIFPFLMDLRRFVTC